jgi:hypothetical protein
MTKPAAGATAGQSRRNRPPSHEDRDGAPLTRADDDAALP